MCQHFRPLCRTHEQNGYRLLINFCRSFHFFYALRNGLGLPVFQESDGAMLAVLEIFTLFSRLTIFYFYSSSAGYDPIASVLLL